ncbi:uncharacterized protein LOC121369909 [Gigantopelta aegis]|uniref:uncharacterized protein LOC121369909 n=1 Tax=Gigantopelta aegis TaxID=1735272 RepID=UPI001B88E3A1|nr:uncharacterized protein LOC121369909 [Gigantopelta aegis]
MSALQGVRGVKLRDKTDPAQPRSQRDGRKPFCVSPQTDWVLPNCGTKQRYALRELLRQNSIVYAKRGRRLPKVCQRTPKLRAVLLRDHTFHCQNVSSSLPPVSSAPGYVSAAQNTATASSHEDKQDKHNKLHKHLRGSAVSRQLLSRSDSFFPLPSDLTLLRRPTFVSSLPVINRDVHLLAQSLKPLVIEDSFIKTVRFYQTHYPLLLERKTDDVKEKIVTRRCVTPMDEEAIINKRAKDMNRRIVRFDQQLDTLEKDVDSDDFVTELRAETFDPRQWAWNSTRYL